MASICRIIFFAPAPFIIFIIWAGIFLRVSSTKCFRLVVYFQRRN